MSVLGFGQDHRPLVSSPAALPTEMEECARQVLACLQAEASDNPEDVLKASVFQINVSCGVKGSQRFVEGNRFTAPAQAQERVRKALRDILAEKTQAKQAASKAKQTASKAKATKKEKDTCASTPEAAAPSSGSKRALEEATAQPPCQDQENAQLAHVRKKRNMTPKDEVFTKQGLTTADALSLVSMVTSNPKLPSHLGWCQGRGRCE